MPAYEVTLKLIKIWSEDKIQEELDGCKKNKQIYDKIAARMTKAESVEGMSTWTCLTIFHCSLCKLCACITVPLTPTRVCLRTYAYRFTLALRRVTI